KKYLYSQNQNNPLNFIDMKIFTSTIKIITRKLTALVSILVFLKLLFFSSVYGQQSYTFTNCGNTGRFGPTQPMINAAYGSTNLNGIVTVVGLGVQQWTVPVSGNYGVRACGASGKSTTISCSNTGGFG